MRDVIRRLVEGLERGRELIVCQVVETRGSTPQKAGALMVLDPDGGQAGTLGGGCVENEVKQLAIRHAGGGVPAVHSFVLDHDYAWADGLICGGKMVVVTQSARGPEAAAYFRSIDQAIEGGQGFTEAIVVEPEREKGMSVGSRFLIDDAGRTAAAWPEGHAPEWLSSHALSLGARARPAMRSGVALLPHWPRVRLVIVGAGHVGQAVASLATQADFDVCVVDDRRQYANAERFPTAKEIVVAPIDQALRELHITPRTYALIVTRGHGHDQEALYHLAPSAASYVGLIGSKRKIRLIFDNLRAEGIEAGDLERVSAPVGLEIGSQSVPEIAISIVAELIARRNLGSHAVVRNDGATAGSLL
jgi:xanthine dehydrogenase accessory factor